VLEECLPESLRGPSTTITRIAAGLSGAGVYRVEAGGVTYVLKVSSGDEPLAEWRAGARIQQLAASAGLAPQVIHVDDARRAVTAAFVVDRGFMPRVHGPHTRAAAIAQLGRTLRRVHDLPIPEDAPSRDLRGFLARVGSSVPAPAFAHGAIERLLEDPPPPNERADVLSHNDVNPTNLVYDGDNLLLLDWAIAGPNDALYDVAAISVFLRMDGAGCRALLAAHDGAPVDTLPARFVYNQRLIAILCGTLFLRLAHQGGYAGDTGATLDTAPSLGEIYRPTRGGSLDIASGEGKWAFGLALFKASDDYAS
jgi:aminoglycoside phosphotransferase